MQLRWQATDAGDPIDADHAPNLVALTGNLVVTRGHQLLRGSGRILHRLAGKLTPTQRAEIIDLGVKAGVVEKSGAWFSYDSVRIGQGRENSKRFLLENPETTSGGNALKFYASVRLDIRRTGQIKEREDIVGNSTRVKVVKNKVAPPFKQVEFDIMYGQGISKVGEIIDLGVKAGVVEKSGAWFSYDSVRIGQGRENSKRFLLENPEMMAKLEKQIRGNEQGIAEEMMTGPLSSASDNEDSE